MSQSSAPVHLSKFEEAIPSGAEWRLETRDWMVLHLCEGIVYALNSKGNKELPQGGVIVCPPHSDLTLTASVLGRAVFRGMAIRVSSLTGFLTALERQGLETDVARQCEPFLALPAENPLVRRLTQILEQNSTLSLAGRLAFAQTFAELVEPQLAAAMSQGRENVKNQQDAKGRLRQIISQVPESELSNLSLGEMAKMLHCCERHASRLFREEWGTGFLAYVSDLRLKKACDLLLQGHLKIIDVALESGHGSLAHFNYVFKKRFRMTPTEWRERQISPPSRPTRHSARSRPLQMAAVVVWLLLSVMGASRSVGAAVSVNTNSPSSPAPATRAASAPAAIMLQVDRYEVRGNTLLPGSLLSRVLAPYTGDAVDTNTVARAVGALQMEYFARGFVTAKVSVPQQQVTNRIIIFQVTEGRLSAVRILHNRYFSSNNIMAALPYLRNLESGKGIMNKLIFEGELNRANSNPDRQISSEVRPGLESGDSALILDVKDRLPLHGRLEFDNYSPPGTPELRLNANASYANLWQLDHTLGVQYGFSPERMKPSLGDDTHLSLNPMDGPEVSYYSAFYRAPLGAPAAVEDQIARDQTQFGYNEVTRQFVLPPATGRPEFSAYASRSTTGPTLYGPESYVVNNPGFLTIQQQLITQQYTSQTTVGGRLSFPLPAWGGIQSSWSVGMDYKEDKVVTLPTNNFYYTTTVTHGAGNGPPTTTNNTIAVGVGKTFPALNYMPLSLGWNGSRQDHWGQGGAPGDRWSQFNGGVSLVAGTGGIYSKPAVFPSLIANTTEATTGFLALRPQLSRTQVLPDNFTFFGSLSGQWASQPMLNLEQLGLGGNGSVRGYEEGEIYADTGWVGKAEFRSPVYWRGGDKRIGAQITAFTDYGEGYQLRPGATPGSQALWGAGAGVNFNLGPYVESHILVGWPIMNGPDSVAGHEHITFSLSAQL